MKHNNSQIKRKKTCMESKFKPQFISMKVAKEMFGLSIQRLSELCATGAVRTVKLGESKQAGRLFHVNDIEQALLRLSEGKILKKKNGNPRFPLRNKTQNSNPNS